MKRLSAFAVCLAAVGLFPTTPSAAQTALPTPGPAGKGEVSAKLLGLDPAPATGVSPRLAPRSRADLSAVVDVRDGYVLVEAVSVGPDATALLRDLEARGLRDGKAYGALVAGRLPVGAAAGLRGLPTLRHIRPALPPELVVGSVTSQGDRAMRSDIGREISGLTGAGVKVGILSDSYDALGGAAEGIASDDLPDEGVEVLEDFLEPRASDEGRAMAEIIHDVAPGAELAFHTAFGGIPNFASGIEELAAAGCDVIVDDVSYFASPFYSPGLITQAVNKVARQGVAYFSSAGNSGDESLEQPFRNAGPFSVDGLGVLGDAHEFAPGDVTQSVTIGPGQTFIASFQWDDPFFSATGVRGADTDLDVLVFFQGTFLGFLSGLDANVGGDPVELIGLTNNGTAPATVELVVVKFDGPDPSRIKFVYFRDADEVEYDEPGSTIVGQANAQRGIAVGASAYFNTPVFNDALETPRINGFSSLGGTPILFNERGRRLRRPRVFEKPEVVGPDGVNTSFFPTGGFDFEGDGFPNFFGTSASAPHVAAVGALVKEATRSFFTPVVLELLLTGTAQDMDNPATPGFDRGFDFRTGYGFVRADRILRIFGGNNRGLAARSGPLTEGDVAALLAGDDLDALAPAAGLHPNPAHTLVTLRLDGEPGERGELTLHDAIGRQVLREVMPATSSGTALDVSALDRGVYVARIAFGERVTTQTLVIE